MVREVGSGVSVCDAALGVAADPSISRLRTAGRAGVPLRASRQSSTRAGANWNSHTSHHASQSETPDQTGSQRGQYNLSWPVTQPGEKRVHTHTLLDLLRRVHCMSYCISVSFLGEVFGV